MDQDRAPLRLDTTGQFLGGPLVGPHTNLRPVPVLMTQGVAALERISGN